MTTRTRLAGYAAAVTLAGAALTGITPAAANAAPASPAVASQTISAFRCASVAVPGTYGTFTHCVNFALSKNSAGQWVSIPYQCKGTNNSGGNLSWYREAQYGYGGQLEGTTSPPEYTMGNGVTEQWTCSGAFQWIPTGNTHFVRASVQEIGQSATTGVNVSSAW